MSYSDTLSNEVDDIFGISWEKREGKVVPETTDVTKSQAVELDATFLYADLAGSSRLAKLCPWETTAKILRAYLDCSTRLIRVWGGEIRSFDGDRVMGVFVGDSKNTNSSYCAREIDYFMEKILRPKAKEKFKSISDNAIHLRHCIGIDTGTSRAVRAGIRDNNDLIWIGKAPSFAAKLSDKRDFPYEVYISSRCYSVLASDGKEVDGADIWVAEDFTFVGETETVYKTKTMKTP